jgi:ubiquinone/menaquinone biosynthesis C-methylase UbiE
MTTEDPTTRVAQIYDQIADAYTAMFWEDQTDAPETDTFLAQLPPGGHILDAGCGPGNISRVFVERGFRVTGIDISQRLIDIARQRVPQATFELGDVRVTAFPDATFDGAYLAYPFEHLLDRDVPRALSEMRRVLKPGGAVFIAAKAGSGEQWLDEPMAGGALCFFNFFDPNALEQAIVAAGFRLVLRARKTPVTPGEMPNEKLLFVGVRD